MLFLQFREEIQQNLHEITKLHILLKDGDLQSQTTNAYIEQVKYLGLCCCFRFLTPTYSFHYRYSDKYVCVWQLLSHLAEQKMKHERMVQLQNQIMSENARLHGGLQIAGNDLERTGHISRDLEFANQMVRDENQRSAYECWAAYSTNYSLTWLFRNREKRVYFRVASHCLTIFSLTISQLSRVVSSLELNFPPSSIFSLRLQDRIQELLETVGALREELRGSFKSSEVALSNMTVERREWQVENASMLTSINGFTRID